MLLHCTIVLWNVAHYICRNECECSLYQNSIIWTHCIVSSGVLFLVGLFPFRICLDIYVRPERAYVRHDQVVDIQLRDKFGVVPSYHHGFRPVWHASYTSKNENNNYFAAPWYFEIGFDGAQCTEWHAFVLLKWSQNVNRIVNVMPFGVGLDEKAIYRWNGIEIRCKYFDMAGTGTGARCTVGHEFFSLHWQSLSL